MGQVFLWGFSCPIFQFQDAVKRLIIRSFVDRGVIKPERIDESFNRILKLKYRAGQTSEEYLTHQLEDARKELAALKKPDGTKPEVKEVKSDASPEETQPEEDSGKKKKKKKS